MSKVNYDWLGKYHKDVSDENVRTVLDRISSELGNTVNVMGGDRKSSVKGGSSTSMHNKGRAADFCVDGYTLKTAFEAIRSHKDKIFDANEYYEVIHHGEFSETGGQHLHVGHRDWVGSGVIFEIEGYSSSRKGVYEEVP